MRDWKLPWVGGCRCGRVRFRVTAAPLLASACHCSGCQKMTASAFSTSLAIPADAFVVTKGKPALGGLHGASKHFFCPYCKSWMFTRPEGLDWLVNLRATMLDEHGWFVPFVELYTNEGLPWARTPARHSFGTLPDNERFMEIAQEYGVDGAGPG